MNKKQFIKDIKNGKNLEVNLPQYANALLTSYYKFSIIRFTMNYFTYYQVICDHENDEIEQVKDLNNEINQIIKDSLFSDFNGSVRERVVKQLDTIRNNIIKKMKVLTSYTDILQIYEHVLNRVEYKFKENHKNLDEESFANQVIEYIFNTKDNVIINDKIKEIIGQLPVRMTKTKYFDLLKDSLSVYKGAEQSSVDNYIYMLRTSAMLYKPEGMDEYFTNLRELIEELESVSYKELDVTCHKRLINKIQKAAKFIEDTVDSYVSLQEIVNNLYAMVLANPYVTDDNEKDAEICKSIIKVVYDNFNKEEFGVDIEEAASDLSLIEGRQEVIFSEYLILESDLYDIKTNNQKLIASLMISNQYDCLSIVQTLLSSSIFIELNETDTSLIAEEGYIEQETKKLINDLEELFSVNEQCVNRAIIANTINKMPVFFNSSDEVINYIKGVLTMCHDEAEKSASIQIITELMEI